jgi:asparagine synthase (glutamine-hydrolysing)
MFAGALGEQADAAERILRGHMAEAPGARPLEAALFLDGKLGLVDDMLTYFDRASMAKSLEVRVPFLDHELVELAATIPTSVKVHRLQGKHVLKRAAKGLVPDFVLDKRKRGFFNESVPTWLNADGGAALEVLGADSPAYAELVDPGVVRRAVTEFRGGQTRHAPLLLSLIMLETWLGEYRPRAFAEAAEPARAAA